MTLLAASPGHIADIFSSTSRRLWATFAFAAGTMLLSPKIAAQEKNALPASPQTTALAANDSISAEDRAKVRAELYKRAERRFFTMMDDGGSLYSRQLQKLEREMNQYLADYHPEINRKVFVLDPLDMDTGLALGITPDQTVIDMMIQRDINWIIDPDVASGVARDMLLGTYATNSGALLSISSPHMLPYTDLRGTQIRIVTPQTDYAPDFRIPNVSRVRMAEFVNWHEGWHAVDVNYDSEGVNFQAARKILYDGTPADKVADGNFLNFAALTYNGEMFADVAAAGEVVFRGADPEVIGRVRDKRLLNDYDLLHMSVAGLELLQGKIKDMRVEGFRKLDLPAREKIYRDICRETEMTPRTMKLTYAFMAAAADERIKLLEENRNDPDLPKIQALIRCVYPPPSEALTETAIDTAGVEMVLRARDAAERWDVMKDIEGRAIRHSGMLTPYSLAWAYRDCMKEMNRQFREGGEIVDRAAANFRMIRLKLIYFDTVPSMDFIDANARHGINLLKQDPTLLKPAPNTIVLRYGPGH